MYILYLISIVFSVTQILCSMPEFFVLVPSYNNEKYCLKNLISIAHQYTSNAYEVYIINDASIDNTGPIIEDYIKKHNLKHVKVIHNKHRVGSLENIYNSIHNYCKDNKIVVLVDGDDALSDPKNVLIRLEMEYMDPNVWITYGSFREADSNKKGFCEEIPLKILETRSLRKHPLLFSHLKTFRASLFKKIKKEDLQYKNKFLSAAGDIAFMIPMLEMAAPLKKGCINHSMFIKDMLYEYTFTNPLSDFRIHSKDQQFFDKYIRKKAAYAPLEKL